eukprot:TRINITY_DN24032_c0_g1_i1.p1 TRINITY_DN24032_c0_g1~~TRINITY_DN24032_c0_g1_i1.p1  ORF type:complete len:187 (-),score=48.80 TRINITY_DN24032_c0_g1_i1:69-629(-)
MIRRPPRSTLSSSSAASDVYKRQAHLILVLDGLENANLRLVHTGRLVRGAVTQKLSALNIQHGDKVLVLGNAPPLPGYSARAPLDMATIQRIMSLAHRSPPLQSEVLGALLGDGGPLVQAINGDADVQSALANHQVLEVFKAMLESPETAHLALRDAHVGPLLTRLSRLANNQQNFDGVDTGDTGD